MDPTFTPPAPGVVRIGMTVIAIAVALAVAVGCARAWRAPGRAWSPRAGLTAVVSAALWLVLGLELASIGLLARFDLRPPAFPLLLLATLGLVLELARSHIGRRLAAGLPLAALVGLHGFRLPLELVMHQAALVGVMPVQMSFTGWNFDILTGASALLLAPWCARARPPLALVRWWNVAGLLLLAIIVGVAIASLPVFAAFGRAPERLNTWVLHAPYVWLPQVLVAAALLGHLLIARRIGWPWAAVVPPPPPLPPTREDGTKP